ncbi:MAG TPA: divalent-cation tolerance protein CutA [Candidatus Solibacter sp.]|jgi:periplasmic divalent cation tolerance protein|nr:divalent-cation tolerance protein CutA [Candidatus Solibacter sp.]
MSTKAYVVLTTVGSEEDARTLAHLLVESERAACVTVVAGTRSTYRWEGKVVEQGECLLVIKAPRRAVPALREAILDHHPYELPELLVLEADGVTDEYAAWLEASTLEP